MSVQTGQPTVNFDTAAPEFAWLEITGKCQLSCTHCYADSGPNGTHGQMTASDWQRVIEQLAALGVGMVQFIGGEPTLHPALPTLIDDALVFGVQVEVFSNLVHVPPTLWPVLSQPGVGLATSYYSDDPAEHAAITARPTHRRTRANIAEAVRRGIPIRAGIVDVIDGQRTTAAEAELAALGVRDIGMDRVRGIGRGTREQSVEPGELCGRCTSAVIAIGPDGAVWPCVFSRWLPMGNVREQSLATVLNSPKAAQVQSDLNDAFAIRDLPTMPCVPNMCDPQCGPSCSPACRPAGNCRPAGGCVPSY